MPGFSARSDPKLTVQCFAIYSGNPACGRTYKLVLEELGLTYTQSIAIAALSKENNQTVTGLGQKLLLESNMLSPILKKPEAWATCAGSAPPPTSAGS